MEDRYISTSGDNGPPNKMGRGLFTWTNVMDLSMTLLCALDLDDFSLSSVNLDRVWYFYFYCYFGLRGICVPWLS